MLQKHSILCGCYCKVCGYSLHLESFKFSDCDKTHVVHFCHYCDMYTEPNEINCIEKNEAYQANWKAAYAKYSKDALCVDKDEVISGDGYADGGTPYTQEEMDLING